jgi:hypothetical protein
MKLINEKYKSIINEDYVDKNEIPMFWVYDPDKADFFIKTCLLWQNIKTDTYKIKIGKDVISIPYNYHIIIGDYDGGLDCISPEEIVGRKFQAFTFSNDIDENSWILDDLRIVGVEQDIDFLVPFVKGIFPILLSDKRAILVSSIGDCYNKIKNISVADLI